MSTCRYDDTRGWLLRDQHDPGCDTSECTGCRPCTHDPDGTPVRHCTNLRGTRGCTSHLGAEPLTCPRCIHDTRADIRLIVGLSQLMLSEAQHAGINSEAAYLAGPAADPGAWTQRRIEAARHGAYLAEMEPEDPHHPYLVLGRWELMLAEDYGHDRRDPITIETAAAYLDSLLSRMAQSDTQDWPLFASEMRTCRAHLETVLHNSRRPEQGAPCPSCPPPAPRLVKRYADHDTTGASDTWSCHNNHTWKEADYRLRIGGTYRQHAAELTADDIHATYGVPAGTVRRWAAEGSVAKAGHRNGRTLYRVDSVIARRPNLPADEGRIVYSEHNQGSSPPNG